MAEHFEELPIGKGFPTADDMRRWQKTFDELIPGGNAGELVGFRIADTGELMGVCRLKADGDA